MPMFFAGLWQMFFRCTILPNTTIIIGRFK